MKNIKKLLISSPVLWGLIGILIWGIETYIFNESSVIVSWSILSIVVSPILVMISLIVYYKYKEKIPWIFLILIFITDIILVIYVFFVFFIIRNLSMELIILSLI